MITEWLLAAENTAKKPANQIPSLKANQQNKKNLVQINFLSLKYIFNTCNFLS